MGVSPFNLAGCDEAGRGALAGPVVASAVVLDYSSIDISMLNDSKALTKQHREKAYRMLRESNSHISFSIINHKVIDSINILKASLLAMVRSVKYLDVEVHKVIVDGNKCPDIEGVDVEYCIQGDKKILEISAASIVAKVLRDRIMSKYASYFDGYGFEKHKGYATKEHYERIFQKGRSPIHRLSFSVQKQLSLFT